MSLTAIKNKVTSKIGRQVLITQKHSPTLLFVAGTVGVVATVVLASRATLKMEELIGEAEALKEGFDEAVGKTLKSGEKYTEEDAKQDGIVAKTQTALKIVKLYAPTIAVGIVSIGCFTGSHVILNRRNVALTAAYGAVDKAFREYRGRVIDEFGVGKDREFRFGSISREVAVETDEGTSVKTIKGADPEFAKKSGGRSMYSVVFDEGNRNWRPTWGHNQMFLRSQEQYANDLLSRDGYVYLNDVYRMLGFERTKAGQVVGWVKGNGDDYISFGILDNGYESTLFVNGDERSVWLDFNVDGVVLDLMSDEKGPA